MNLKNLFILALIGYLSVACQSNESKSKELVGEASGALANGQSYPVAEKILRQAVALDPNNTDASAFLADQLYLQRKYGEATTIYQQLTQQDADNPEFYTRLIEVLIKQKRIDEAIAAYQQGIKQVSNPSSLNESKVALIVEQKQVNQAIEICQKQTLDDHLGQSYSTLGQMLSEQDHVDAAVTCYLQAIQQNPNDLNRPLEVAHLLRNWGKLDEAVSVYRQVLQRPWVQKDAQATLYVYRSLISTLFVQKDYDAVIAECRKTLQIAPSDPYVNQTLAYALEAQRKL